MGLRWIGCCFFRSRCAGESCWFYRPDSCLIWIHSGTRWSCCLSKNTCQYRPKYSHLNIGSIAIEDTKRCSWCILGSVHLSRLWSSCFAWDAARYLTSTSRYQGTCPAILSTEISLGRACKTSAATLHPIFHFPTPFCTSLSIFHLIRPAGCKHFLYCASCRWCL